MHFFLINTAIILNISVLHLGISSYIHKFKVKLEFICFCKAALWQSAEQIKLDWIELHWISNSLYFAALGAILIMTTSGVVLVCANEEKKKISHLVNNEYDNVVAKNWPMFLSI